MIITTLKGAVGCGLLHVSRKFRRLPDLLAVLATCAVAASCDSSASDITGVDGTVVDLSRATIEAVSGNEQETEVESPIAEPLVVVVKDVDGKPIPGVPLEWSFTQGRGRSANASGTATEVILTETDQAGRSVECQRTHQALAA